MVVAFVLLADTIEGFYSLQKGFDKFVVNVKQFPGLSIGRILVVIIIENLFIDIIDI